MKRREKKDKERKKMISKWKRIERKKARIMKEGERWNEYEEESERE